ncbi:hypothetical protein HWV62_5660 [Athelia sp. TMB]|nr:hypothetical protein HWV62_5660 [Athelia sp. TMB]
MAGFIPNRIEATERSMAPLTSVTPLNVALFSGLVSSSYFFFGGVGIANVGIMHVIPDPAGAKLAVSQSRDYDVAKWHMGGAIVGTIVSLSTAAFLAPSRALALPAAGAAFLAFLVIPCTALMGPVNDAIDKLAQKRALGMMGPHRAVLEERALAQIYKRRRLHIGRIALGAGAWVGALIAFTVHGSQAMVYALFVPACMAGASIVVLGLNRMLSSSEHATTTKLPAEVNETRYGAVFIWNALRLVGCLALFGLSIASLAIHPGEHSLLYARVCICVTFVYAVVLAAFATFGPSKHVSYHLTFLLVTTFGIYAYRDIYPLGTFDKSPLDLSEGALLWPMICVLGATGILVPLCTPRAYTPVDPEFPSLKPSPEQTASPLGLVLWTFLDPVVALANRVSRLEVDQLPPLADTDEAKNLTKRAFPIDSGTGSVLEQEETPCFLGLPERVPYMESGGKGATVRPWVWVLWLLAGPTINSLTSQFNSYLAFTHVVRQMRTLVHTEAIITQLVFEHAFRIRMKTEAAQVVEPVGENAAPGISESGSVAGTVARSTIAAGTTAPPDKGKKKAQGGETASAKSKAKSQRPSDTLIGRINNLVSTDLGNITAARNWLWLVLYIPLQVALCLIFLYRILGWSAFVGFAMIVVTFPVPGYFAKQMKSSQKKKMKPTDERIQRVVEALGVLRMIKLFGWEKKTIERLQSVRDEELSWAKKIRIFDIILEDINFFVPLLTMIATFATYTMIMKKDLAASSVYGSIAGQVSLDRLNTFLKDTELLDAYSEERISPEVEVANIGLDNEETIGFTDARFSWSGRSSDSTSRHQFQLRLDGEVVFKRGALNLVVGPTGAGKTSLLMALLGSPSVIRKAIVLI